MKRSRALKALAVAGALALAGTLTVAAQATPSARQAATSSPPAPTYVPFSPSATKGALYYPDPAIYPTPHVGVIAMHRDSNYLSHISTKELPKRGFVVLGMNPRCDNNEAACAPWENNALDVKQGVNYLRSLPGITKVVLLGHSGGGPTMTFYEAVAEQGVGFCQQPNKLVKCSDALAGLPPVDGVMLMDAHPGNGVNAVRSISADVTNDKAVLNRGQEPQTNWRLDPFNPRNGYRPDGKTHYSKAFKRRYFRAQSTRMNYLIDQAQKRLAEAEANGQDDAPFVVPMGDNARLSQIDLGIDRGTLQPRKLLKNDGTVNDRFPVNSVRVPESRAGRREEFRVDDASHREVVPQRACSQVVQLIEWHRLVLEQQLDAVQPAAGPCPAARHRDGRSLLHPRCREVLRDGSEP